MDVRLWMAGLAALFLASSALGLPPGPGGPPGGLPGGFGQQAPSYFDSRDQVRVEVAADRTRVAPGDQVRIAVIFDHSPGWHVHTHDPVVPPELGEKDDYYATVIEVDLPPDSPVKAWPQFIAWPEVHEIEVAFAGTPVKYGVYEGRAIAYLPVTIAPDAPPGPVSFTVKPAFQACDANSCLAPTPYPPRPGDPDAAPSQEWLDYGHRVRLEIVPLADAQDRGTIDAATFGGFPEDVWGLIASGAEFVEFDLFGIIRFDLNVGTTFGFLGVLLMAAIGGFLLNLTPCVLPVIPLKIMGLSQSAAGSRGRTLALGLTMAAGVVGFWLLLGGLIAGISGFTATNQLFQYPAFTISVGVFIAIMAIGMCGLFSVRLPQAVYMINPSHETLHGSFVFGIMTAILSTPCTAPFMGAAAAWAATKSAVVTLSAFAAIGAGMAFPYLVLSAWPKLVERMPRTGPASDLIKQVMGLLMLAAAAYFVGVGLSGAMVTPPDPPSLLYWWAVAALGIAAGAWLAWRTARITAATGRRIVFGGLGVVILLISAAVGLMMTDKGPIDWVYYTPQRFAEAKGGGKVVMMEFTAEWCLNCKTLEKTVLRSERIVQALEQDDVVPIKVDLTGNNAMGNAMLSEVDRLTIPLLVIFRPDGTEAFKGDYYTVDQVIDALRDAAGTQVAKRDGPP